MALAYLVPADLVHLKSPHLCVTDPTIIRNTAKHHYIRGIWPSYLSFKIANNKGTDQTAHPRSLVCAFVVRKQQSQVGGYDAEA